MNVERIRSKPIKLLAGQEGLTAQTLDKTDIQIEFYPKNAVVKWVADRKAGRQADGHREEKKRKILCLADQKIKLQNSWCYKCRRWWARLNFSSSSLVD